MAGAKGVLGGATFTTEKVVEQFKECHGPDRYDYSYVVHINSKTKVEILCNKCGKHFWQLGSAHKKGAGCPYCAIKEKGARRTLSQEEIIKKFNFVHGIGSYDYSEVVYEHNSTQVKIKCNRCGKTFYQKPTVHLRGSGCTKCNRKRAGRSRRLNREEVIRGFKKVHGNKYIYDFVDYTKSYEKVIICCREHGIFLQTPSDHKSGCGCPKCAHGCTFSATSYGSRFKESKLYVANIYSDKESFIKIGITSQELKKRFLPLPKEYGYKILNSFNMTGYGARLAEIELHRFHKDSSYQPRIFFEGHTECFTNISLETIKNVCDNYKNITLDHNLKDDNHEEFLKRFRKRE